jgi:hypothetical protein
MQILSFGLIGIEPPSALARFLTDTEGKAAAAVRAHFGAIKCVLSGPPRPPDCPNRVFNALAKTPCLRRQCWMKVQLRSDNLNTYPRASLNNAHNWGVDCRRCPAAGAPYWVRVAKRALRHRNAKTSLIGPRAEGRLIGAVCVWRALRLRMSPFENTCSGIISPSSWEI